MLLHPVHCLSFGFGSGLFPKAPGTMGTVAAIPLYVLCSGLEMQQFLLVILIAFLAGIYFCGVTANALGVHDHPAIVWDEIVGYFITMLFAPAGWMWILLGFFAFRVFDIVKPWPIKWLDKRVHGGLGIMIDDVLAGIFACVILQAIVLLL